MTFCIYVNGLIRPHSPYRVWVRFGKQKRILQKVYIRVVDTEPDPDLRGSETVYGIQIRIRNLRFWIWIRIKNLRFTLTKSSKKEIDIYDMKKKHIFGYKTRQKVGARYGRIKNFLQDLDTDPELKVMDPDLAPDPELNLNLIINHQNYINLII
jgi:hypothetical protein